MASDDGLVLTDEELQHLQPILRDPDDDAPRLAFADWCDQRGDHDRARFIRLQVRAGATTGQADFEAGEASANAQALLAKHGYQWTRFMQPYSRGGLFHRGFIMLVADTAAEFLKDADKIFSLAPVQQLDITRLDVDLDELLASPHLLRLRGFSLTRASLGPEGVRKIANAPNLRHLRFLNLSYNDAGVAGAEAIAESPYLRNLVIVYFDQNGVDLNPSLGIDQGFVVYSSPSPAAHALIEKYGPREWLDWVDGNRFTVARWFKDSE